MELHPSFHSFLGWTRWQLTLKQWSLGLGGWASPRI